MKPRARSLSRRVVALGLGAACLVAPSSASAYVDSGGDPEGDNQFEEHAPYADALDIGFTMRAVVQGARRTNLRIGVRLHDHFEQIYWTYIDAKLDVRGGRQADAILHMWILDMSGNGCELQTRTGQLIKKGVFRFVGQISDDQFAGVNCHVPAYRLHRTKPIRWKVSTIYGNGEPVFDTAPNEGMFG